MASLQYLFQGDFLFLFQIPVLLGVDFWILFMLLLRHGFSFSVFPGHASVYLYQYNCILKRRVYLETFFIHSVTVSPNHKLLFNY